MNKKIAFTVNGTYDLKEMTIQYFKKSGFKYKDTLNEGCLRFVRGSIASNMWTFNPLNWKSQIDIEIHEKFVRASFDINTVGQIPTNKEEKLWEIFIENYEKYLHDPNFDFYTENSTSLKLKRSNSLKYLAWAALGGLIGGSIAGPIAYWIGVSSIVPIGAAGGAVALLTKKINDDKRNNDFDSPTK